MRRALLLDYGISVKSQQLRDVYRELAYLLETQQAIVRDKVEEARRNIRLGIDIHISARAAETFDNAADELTYAIRMCYIAAEDWERVAKVFRDQPPKPTLTP